MNITWRARERKKTKCIKLIFLQKLVTRNTLFSNRCEKFISVVFNVTIYPCICMPILMTASINFFLSVSIPPPPTEIADTSYSFVSVLFST